MAVLPMVVAMNMVKDMRLGIMTKEHSIYEGNSEVIYCLVRQVSQGVVEVAVARNKSTYVGRAKVNFTTLSISLSRSLSL
jgi:hypothetical protein